MPIEITGAHPPEHRLEVGDVIMVAKELEDKVTKKPYFWRFFAVVVHLPVYKHVRCLVLDEQERKPMVLRLDRSDTKIAYLHPDEWPDGVYAFRTKLILEGRIEGMI